MNLPGPGKLAQSSASVSPSARPPVRPSVRTAPAIERHLVPSLDEIVAQLLDGVGGRTRLCAFSIVGDHDRLHGLDDDYAALVLFVLQHKSDLVPTLCSPGLCSCEMNAYLLPVYAPVVCFDYQKLLPRDHEPSGLYLLGAIGACMIPRKMCQPGSSGQILELGGAGD